VLSCASWCQLQRAPLGKLLKLQARFPKYRTHNAGVEGSSPSLSILIDFAPVCPNLPEYLVVLIRI